MDTITGFTKSGLLCLLLTSVAGACYGKEMDLMYEFQLEQLIDPSEEQLIMESEGQVFIYDGLKDSDIQLALDTQQHRMQSMMFVNVIWTDKDGQPVVDPYTGQIVTDDDC
jgi:hypothetical protein